MKLGRLAVAGLVLGAALYGAPNAAAANGSNYIHLVNGVDYFFGKTPPNGNFTGIWRCFPSDILHAPTRVVNPNDTLTFQTYATKIVSLWITITASPAPSTIDFPTIALSSSPGTCAFLTSGGTALNYGLASVAGFGTPVVGPINGGTINLLAGIAGASITSPTTAPGQLVQLELDLEGLFAGFSTVAVPEGESLVYWVQDDPTQTGAGNMQYWTGSVDEKNLCSSYSYLLSTQAGGLTAFAFVPNFEWSIGLGTLDATFSTYVSSTGPGPSSLNAHGPQTGITQPFDSGSGSRTISVSDAVTPPGPELLGFATYNEASPFATAGRLVLANIEAITTNGQFNCFYITNPGEIFLATGGPGGPVLSNATPQRPRIVGKFDVLTNALLTNPIWLAGSRHNVTAGGINIPWFAGAGGNPTIFPSGATGNTGGFAFPIPAIPQLVGLTLFFSNVALNGSGTAITPNAANGHVHANGYDAKFFP